MSRMSRRFVPRLEVLGDRSLPSVSYEVVGSTLLVHGDAGANTITITDDGTATGITVDGDGSPYPAVGDTPVVISAIAVDTGGGNDTVVYNLTGTLSVTRLVSVDLGRGLDEFTINLNQNTITGAAIPTNFGFTATGDGGGDTLTLNANGAHVDANASLSVNFLGEAGKDTIAFNFDPGFLDLGNVTLTKDQKH